MLGPGKRDLWKSDDMGNEGVVLVVVVVALEGNEVEIKIGERGMKTTTKAVDFSELLPFAQHHTPATQHAGLTVIRTH
jgi:hypothetical protein